MLKSLLARIKREPLMVLAVLLAVGLTVYRVYVDHMPLADVFTEDYVNQVFVLATGLIGRFLVFAPASVREAVERALGLGGDERP